MHVTRLTSVFCNGLPEYCKRIPQIVGVVLWPRFRGPTVHGPVFRAMIRLACVWGPCSNPHSVNIAAARARAALFLFEFLLVVTRSRPGRSHSNNKVLHRCCAHSYPALCQTSSSKWSACSASFVCVVEGLLGALLALLGAPPLRKFIPPFASLAHSGAVHNDSVSIAS